MAHDRKPRTAMQKKRTKKQIGKAKKEMERKFPKEFEAHKIKKK